ncbi:MAG: type IX secretion system protein PorQ [Prolixibacteraceae bacterium]|nr:type IX secretion system protein PorQ [Prolixibacteraceae bacterium]
MALIKRKNKTRMAQKYIIILLLALIVKLSHAQIGGESTYQFLDLTNSARIAALGGTQVAISDSEDLNLPYYNPSSLAAGMSNQVLFNYVNYFADINFGYVSYARTFEGIGNFALGMHYINYGKFIEATETGTVTGNEFKAAEYAMNIIYSNQYKRLKYGVNLKPVFSVFESYNSFGIALDLGISYSSKNELTNVGLVAKNIGTQISTYYQNGEREPIPFDIQAGISSRLSHAPVVLHATLQHLNNWDLANPEPDEEEANEIFVYEPQESFGKQLMRHMVFGIELLPSKNFTIRAGYNYQRRQELMMEDHASTVGFSLGFGVHIKRYRLDFATSRFHLAGSSNLFSLAINLNEAF